MLLLLKIFTTSSILGFSLGDEICVTPSGAIGACIPVTSCGNFQKIAEGNPQLLHDFKCGHSRGNLQICCPQDTTNRFLSFGALFNNFFHNNPNGFQNSHNFHNHRRPSGGKNFHNSQNDHNQVRPSMSNSHNFYDSHHHNQKLFTSFLNKHENFDNTENHHKTSTPDFQNFDNPKKIRNWLPKNCGVTQTDDKIVGGETASLNEFPWMALLAYKSGNGKSINFRCGGSIINDRYILTAAHCLEGTIGKQLVGIRVGEYNVKTVRDCEDVEQEFCAPPVQDLVVEKIIVHPLYNMRGQNENDIALLRVQPINVGQENAKPICLPVANENDSKSGEKMTVTGWGITEKRAKSDVLLKVHLPIVSRTNCQESYAQIQVITDRQICAGGEVGKDSCNGDSGGPLQVMRPIDGELRYVQYGIVSYGPSHCGASTTPGVYTRVAAYIDWILENVEN